MTPPTHTYAIFDPDGKNVFNGQPSDDEPDDVIRDWLRSEWMVPDFDHWIAYKSDGWTCKPVTVTITERSEGEHE